MDGAMLIPEFDHEFAETRRALERVPEEQFSWRPHDKSWTLFELAAHVAEVPNWVGPTLTVDTLDLDADYERVVPETKEEMLAQFDASVASARALLEETPASTMGETWRMLTGGNVALEMPKGAVLRSFIFNHNVHHRAQLGVYLRMLNVAVPGHYGPSADEVEAEAAAD